MPDIVYIEFSRKYVCTHCGIFLKRKWEDIPNGAVKKGVVFYCIPCNKRFYHRKILISEELK